MTELKLTALLVAVLLITVLILIAMVFDLRKKYKELKEYVEETDALNGVHLTTNTKAINSLNNRVTASDGTIATQGEQLLAIDSRLGNTVKNLAGWINEYQEETQNTAKNIDAQFKEIHRKADNIEASLNEVKHDLYATPEQNTVGIEEEVKPKKKDNAHINKTTRTPRQPKG